MNSSLLLYAFSKAKPVMSSLFINNLGPLSFAVRFRIFQRGGQCCQSNPRHLLQFHSNLFPSNTFCFLSSLPNDCFLGKHSTRTLFLHILFSLSAVVHLRIPTAIQLPSFFYPAIQTARWKALHHTFIFIEFTAPGWISTSIPSKALSMEIAFRESERSL